MPTAAEFREKGYVHVGYFPPELSSSDEYPDYIKEEVEDSIKKILSYQNTDSVTFAFMTDLHYAPTYNHHIRLTRTLNAYKAIDSAVTIDKLILGGDLGANGEKAFAAKAFYDFRMHFYGLDYYPVLGNHDDNTIWDQCTESETTTNYFTHDELYSMLFNHLTKSGVEFDKNNRAPYYYCDDKYSKTRYIFLDTTDVPYIIENGKLKYGAQHIYAISQKQTDWLCNEALRFSEDGWSVIVSTHTAETPTVSQPDEINTLGAIRAILRAYKTGKNIHESFGDGDFKLDVNADFSNYTRGDFIAVLVGHFHADKIDYEDGLPYIFTSNATMYCHGDHIRKDGDKSEILFDVMTVDKRTRKIYITRVGYGEDRIATY